MPHSGKYRISVMILGLLACAIIVLAGGYRFEITKKSVSIEQGAKDKEAGKEDTQTTYLSAPSEAVPGASAGINFDCPSCTSSSSLPDAGEDEIEYSLPDLVNHYFRTLVRSLIRTNAP